MRIRMMLLLAIMISAPAAAQRPDRQAERDLFKRTIEIPTVVGRGEMPKLTALLTSEYRKAGITDITIKKHGDTESMIVRWPAAERTGLKPILLLAHMDVVEARRADWKHDPFAFREEDGYYLGRGTADMKSGLVAIVASMIRLKKSGFRPQRDIVALFTGDEETAQDGARLASTQWRGLVDAEYALNADAGSGTLKRDGTAVGFSMQVSEKVYATYSFSATNRGGHSSRPRPDNAIYQLAGALKALEEHRFPQQLDDVTRGYFKAVAAQDGGGYGELINDWLAKPDDPELADLVETMSPGMTRTRCVATRLEGGHADNALPQTAKATVNCRIFPGVDAKTVEATLQALAGQGVKVAPTEDVTPSPASALRPDVLKAYSEAIRKIHPNAPVYPSMSPGATDGLYFRASGMPVYGVGARWSYSGDQSGAHGLDEKVPVKAFEDAVDIWTDMLRVLARR